MYSPLRYISYALWKKRPIQLTFFVTARCNSRCPFCFYLRRKNKERDAVPELMLGEIEKISRSLGSLLWVLFSGGEAYLREDLVEISKIFYENNKPAILTYPTNGLLPELIREKTEEILKHCKKSAVAVKLSLDGLYEEHDSLRNVQGNFKKVIQTYELLGELLDKYPNFELGINTVFCSVNQNNMEEIIGFVNHMDKIKTHTISMIRGDLENNSFTEVNPELYRTAIKKMEENLKHGRANMYRFKGARLKAAQDILQHRLIYQTILQKRKLIPCYAGRLNLVLTETGNVYACELFNQKMGNVRNYNYNMKKLLQSAEARKVVEAVERNKCYCSHECYFMTNILFNPKMYGALLREYAQL